MRDGHISTNSGWWTEPRAFALKHKQYRSVRLRTYLIWVAFCWTLWLSFWFIYLRHQIPGINAFLLWLELGSLLSLVVLGFYFFQRFFHVSHIRLWSFAVFWFWGNNRRAIRYREVKFFEWLEDDGYCVVSLAPFEDGEPFQAAVPNSQWRTKVTAFLLYRGLPIRLDCPRCGSTHSAMGSITQEAWATCQKCDQVFPLAEVFPGFPSFSFPTEDNRVRPIHARVIAETIGNGIFFHVPRETATMSGTLYKVLFWFVIALATTFAGIAWHNPMAFWFLVLLCAFGGVWFIAATTMTWTTKTARLSQTEMIAESRWLRWSKTRKIPFDKLRCARTYVGSATLGVQIIWVGGSFVLPTSNMTEQRWLIRLINDFITANQKMACQ
jgi:hypothetical protein